MERVTMEAPLPRGVEGEGEGEGAAATRGPNRAESSAPSAARSSSAPPAASRERKTPPLLKVVLMSAADADAFARYFSGTGARLARPADAAWRGARFVENDSRRKNAAPAGPRRGGVGVGVGVGRRRLRGLRPLARVAVDVAEDVGRRDPRRFASGRDSRFSRRARVRRPRKAVRATFENIFSRVRVRAAET